MKRRYSSLFQTPVDLRLRLALMNLRRILLFALLAPSFLNAAEEGLPQTVVSVQIARVIKTTLFRSITGYGLIEPEPATSGKMSARAGLSAALPGIITETNGIEGKRVEKGDILFQLDSRAVDADLVKAELALSFAEKNVDRQKKLIAADSTSEKLVLEAEQALAGAQADLATAKVQRSLLTGVAPLSGMIVKFSVRPGEAVDTTTVLAEIVDLDRLVASVSVPQREAIYLKAGQPARINDFETTVAYISPFVAPDTDTILVRLPVPKGSKTKPGEFVSAQIVIENRPDTLAVPREAVYTDASGTSTVSLVEGDTARQIVVAIGLQDNDLIEVSGEGIQEGATVVTQGSYALPEVTKIHILPPTVKEDTP